MPKLLPSPKVIGVVGSRRRNDIEDCQACFAVLDKICLEGDRLVSGGCAQGGDLFAEAYAKKHGLTITVHYPNWERHGRAAGFVRNTNIAEDCDVLIAVVAPDRTGGTEDTVKKVLKLGKQVIYA